jgi:hypothetical protein
VDGKIQSVKDRWVFPLRPDVARAILLVARDESVLRGKPYLRYNDKTGADFKQWKIDTSVSNA